MEITWYGHSCFRLKSRDATVVIDPFGPGLGLPALKLNADVVLTTHDHPGHNHLKAVNGARRVISGPGEYEIAGVFVNGIDAWHDDERGAQRGRITIYVVQMDDVSVCHLGDIGHKLTDEMLEAIGLVDVLLVPVGGGSSLGAGVAAEVVAQVEPRIVVPMHFRVDGQSTELETDERFIKEMSVTDLTRQPKLVQLGGAATPGEDTRVVLLQKAG
ncbi:MAG: MBL fold metallo-hydrolase [Candidatus Dormibacteria bacterium]